jgi:hypothetical protein
MTPYNHQAARVSAFISLLLGLGFHPAGAKAQSTLAKQVADGRPWAMTMTDGPAGTMTLTLNPDGTGRMAGGPMTMSPTWRETGDGICIKPGMIMPERCATLRKEGSRIIGTSNGEVKFRLERP